MPFPRGSGEQCGRETGDHDGFQEIVRGGLIAFKGKMLFQNGTQPFVYLGKLEGDQITFGRHPEDLMLGVLVEFTRRTPQRSIRSLRP